MNRIVFEGTNFGNLEVKNRFVRSAAASGIATTDGYVTDHVLNWHDELSKGGVGLIIMELMTATEDKNFSEKYLRIDNDSYIEGLKKVTNVVHANGGKIITQLGIYVDLLHKDSDTRAMGPSPVKDHFTGITAMEMSVSDIEFLITEFANAAERSKKAGFDGVQIHGAHGLLLNKFLSPYYNRRTDRYGGSVAKRAQILIDILKAVKERCGEDFPVLLKINSSDFTGDEGEFTFEACRETCSIASEAGYDTIEISGGTIRGAVSPARSKLEVAYHKDYAKTIAEEISIPVIVVGGIRTYDVAEEILQSTNIRGIGMTRALTREPDLIKKWKDGNYDESKCTACNKCFSTEGLMCIFRGGK